MARELVKVLERQTKAMFYTMEITLCTCDLSADLCQAPVWRYIYHTLHSCDRWYINPTEFTQPKIHTEGLDNVEIISNTMLSKAQLFIYLAHVRNKVFTYLESLTDDMLAKKPQSCDLCRLELITGQIRHFVCHIGIINGSTIVRENKYPRVVGLYCKTPPKDALYE